jgi:hypothetical protein
MTAVRDLILKSDSLEECLRRDADEAVEYR